MRSSVLQQGGEELLGPSWQTSYHALLVCIQTLLTILNAS